MAKKIFFHAASSSYLESFGEDLMPEMKRGCPRATSFHN